MADQDWALPSLRKLLPLDDAELRQVMVYTNSLSDKEAAQHLENMLGDSPEALEFVASVSQRRKTTYGSDEKTVIPAPSSPPPNGQTSSSGKDPKMLSGNYPSDPPAYAPPPGPPPPSSAPRSRVAYKHSNDVTKAGELRARDEVQMQQALQDLQYQYGIYNSEIEPEHESDFYCGCPVHQYQSLKWRRLGVQERWARAVMYPGEKFYSDNPNSVGIFSGNPYRYSVVSPYGYRQQFGSAYGGWGVQKPSPGYHAQFITQTIALNNSLNRQAQIKVDAWEPKESIWEDVLSPQLGNMSLDDKGRAGDEKGSDQKRNSRLQPGSSSKGKPSKFAGFKKAMGVKSSEEKEVEKTNTLRVSILAEEAGRWPDAEWRQLVLTYQDKVGMTAKIADLRARRPLQYLHLLRAGYFEPIPVAWANQASNPLKFSVESAAGWRGITPTWRGYEDLAEERLYWVLNHREGSVGMRMKPDFISEMNMAQERMARAIAPPPMYYSESDTCRVQHTDTSGYSKQVPSAPFRAYDRPELPTDDTMVLLDVSGSMDFEPVRPLYNQYLVTGYARSSQPKNKDVAKAIVRRFTDAMAHHDHQAAGYDLITFANQAQYVGSINHQNLERSWRNVRFGGGTRVMTGWQKVKELHFQKHAESAIHHDIYGWQAGPQTPMLRLLLLLDGEATDMDEFELDLLGLSWAHVTIFLIGVDGCPHHHRHANELQRISDVNHHVSFVDAQGNFPERFVTHELLKRHLGYDISMQEFQQMEELPAYSVT